MQRCAQFNAAVRGGHRRRGARPASRRKPHRCNITEHLTYGRSTLLRLSAASSRRHKVTFAWMLAVSVLTSAGKARQ